jgi:serine/threonine protein kinase
MHKWQTSQYPTCTVIHEQRLIDNELGKFLASGAFRQTFEIYDQQTDNPVAMKTIRDRRKENLFTPFYLDRHRVDALIYERTSASPWITDIYGFCGLSGLFEFAGGGTMEDIIFDEEDKKRKSLSRIEKLALAVEAASAIADLHSIDSINGYSAMIHGDIYLNQFVLIGNRFKLNDFNRGHLMYWNEKKQESCPYAWDEGHNGNVSSLSCTSKYELNEPSLITFTS